jgi:hypothetical protein
MPRFTAEREPQLEEDLRGRVDEAVQGLTESELIDLLRIVRNMQSTRGDGFIRPTFVPHGEAIDTGFLSLALEEQHALEEGAK